MNRTLEFYEEALTFMEDVNIQITRMLAEPFPTADSIPQDETSPQIEAAATCILGSLMAVASAAADGPTDVDVIVQAVRDNWVNVSRGHLVTMQKAVDYSKGQR